jgi:hypothetical protein
MRTAHRWVWGGIALWVLGSTGCTLETVGREVRSGSRDMARGLARVGTRIENGLEDWGRDLRGRPASRGSRSGGGSGGGGGGGAPAAGVAGPGDSLPFARAVPGREGFVKLPGRDHLPDMDVRGIPSGTRLDVPDPERPGASIGFRVP